MKTRLLKKLRKKFLKNYKVIWHDGVYWICEWDGYSESWGVSYRIRRKVAEMRDKQSTIRTFNELWHNFALDKVKNIRLNKTRVKL